MFNILQIHYFRKESSEKSFLTKQVEDINFPEYCDIDVREETVPFSKEGNFEENDLEMHDCTR